MRVRPLHVLAVLAAGLLLVYSASVAIVDIDLWWHRWLGVEILQTRTVTGLGNAWAPFGEQSWTTTQWLAEVAYAALHTAGGFSAVTALRLAAGLAIVSGLAWTVLRGRPSVTAVPTYVTALFGLALFVVQDRPQTLALVGAVVLGGWIDRLLHDHVAVRLWWVAALTWVWANVHGSWVLVPGVMALAAVALIADRRPAEARIAGYGVAVAVGAGLLTPAVLASGLALLRFTERTTFLGEWNQVEPLALYGVPVTLLLAATAVFWARDTSPPGEVVLVLGIALFSLAANRNIPFGIVLLAPLVSSIAARSLTRDLPSSNSRAAASLSAALAVVLTATAVVTHSRIDPVSRAEPRTIAATLGRDEGPVRVLNTYEAAGVLLEFSGGDVELGIDGRADRYEPAYVERYFAAVNRLEGVDALLALVDADVAVLKETEALATHLVSRGWTTTMSDGGFVLVEPPGNASDTT